MQIISEVRNSYLYHEVHRKHAVQQDVKLKSEVIAVNHNF